MDAESPASGTSPRECRKESQILRCDECDYQTNRKSNYDRHIKAMHEDAKEEVECCGVTFTNKALLKDHCRNFHSHGYDCKLCQRNFTRKALLKRHMSVHGGVKEFACGRCDYATSHKSNLDRHCLKVHKMELAEPSRRKKRRRRRQTDIDTSSGDFGNSFSDGTDDLSVSLEITSSQESLVSRFNKTSISDVVPIRSAQDLFAESCLIMNEDTFYSRDLTTSVSLSSQALDNRLRLCPQPYKCPTCQKSFKSQLEFLHHYNSIHQTTSNDPEVLSAAKVLTEFKQPINCDSKVVLIF